LQKLRLSVHRFPNSPVRIVKIKVLHVAYFAIQRAECFTVKLFDTLEHKLRLLGPLQSVFAVSYQSINPYNGKTLKTFAELLARFCAPNLVAGNVDTEDGILSA
jgi:hypothetical protein